MSNHNVAVTADILAFYRSKDKSSDKILSIAQGFSKNSKSLTAWHFFLKVLQHQQWMDGQGGKEAVFDGKKDGQLADLTGSNLAGLNLSGIKFNNVSFAEADLSKIVFDDCIFENCDFSYADLTDASFRNCKMYNVNFHYASLHGTEFGNAAFWKVSAKNALSGQK